MNFTMNRQLIEGYIANNVINPLVLNSDIELAIPFIPDKSLDLIVTSPPYYKQRDYEFDGQIGQEQTPEEYINKMVDIFTRLRDKVKDSGCFFLNIGDKYGKKGEMLLIPTRIAAELQKRGWILKNFIVWYKPNHMPSPFKGKFTSTWEPVFFFVKDTGNYTTPDYYFNLDAVRVEHKTNDKDVPDDLPRIVSLEDYEKVVPILEKYKKDYSGKFKDQNENLGASPGARASVNGYSYSKQRVFKPTNDNEIEIIMYLRNARELKGISVAEIDEALGYEHTAGHWFRLDRGGRSLPSPEDWLRLKNLLGFGTHYDEEMTKMHYVLQAVMKHPLGKNPGDMWSILTEKTSKPHFAIYPHDLVRRIIGAACPENGIVLDPFAGSGTTGDVAMEFNLKSIMIDASTEAIGIMEESFEHALLDELRKVRSKNDDKELMDMF